MGCSSKIRWGLALLGGVLAEAGILAVMPVALRFGDQTPLYVIPPTCLVMTCLFGFWVGRRAASHCILHGTLVDVVAGIRHQARRRRGGPTITFAIQKDAHSVQCPL